jgi:transposase
MINAKKQHAAYLLAITGATQAEVASAVKVSERTIRNWLQENEFQLALADYLCQYRRQLMPKALNRLKHIIQTAEDREALQAIHIVLKQAGWLDENRLSAEAPRQAEPGSSGIVFLTHDDPRLRGQ